MARPTYKRNHKERTYDEQQEYKREKKKSKRLRINKRKKEGTE